MWKQIPIEFRDEKVRQSKELMINVNQFLNAMKNVVDNWHYSCEANLTAAMNHQAWLGHAGCAFNHDAPEDLTRLAWSMLTQEQQDLANEAADKAKEYWHAKNSIGV